MMLMIQYIPAINLTGSPNRRDYSVSAEKLIKALIPFA